MNLADVADEIGIMRNGIDFFHFVVTFLCFLILVPVISVLSRLFLLLVIVFISHSLFILLTVALKLTFFNVLS